VLNYADMSYSGHESHQPKGEDNSKDFKILQRFGKPKYRFTKSGRFCIIMPEDSVETILSFPYTKDALHNACFLFMNAENFETFINGKKGVFEDHSHDDSPDAFSG
jgi:hypothetical protein